MIDEEDVSFDTKLAGFTAHGVLLIDKIIQTELFPHPDREQTARDRFVFNEKPCTECLLDGTKGDSLAVDDEHAVTSVDSPGVKCALVELGTTVTTDIAQVFLGKSLPEGFDGRNQGGLFTRMERGAELPLHAAGAPA
jgi:hypothetical protein